MAKRFYTVEKVEDSVLQPFMRISMIFMALVMGVQAGPVITTFTVSSGEVTSDTEMIAAPGAELTFTWVTEGATTVSLIPLSASVALSGTTQIRYDGQPQTYFLNAIGGGFTQKSITVTVDPSTVDPTISEFLAHPDRESLVDDDGDIEDWVELGNLYAFDQDVSGYYLTDDPANLTLWQIPEGVTIPDSGNLLIFASGKNRQVLGKALHTNFKLDSKMENLLLVAPDGRTVVDQFSWTQKNQHPKGKSYGRWGNPEREGFFVTATPGTENIAPFFSPAKVIFGTGSSAFTTEFELTLASPDENLAIRYTIDRSEPTEASPLYAGPIPISESTMVRARLVGADTIGEVSGRHYLKLSANTIPSAAQAGAPNLEGFTSNLPIVVVDSIGPAPERIGELNAGTFTVYEPINGLASLSHSPALTSRAGYRIRGQSSASFAKKQYRFELWNQENQDKDQKLLGMPSDSDFILGAPYVDKALIRNTLAYELGREIGLHAPRTQHVEVFLNTDGGELNYETDYQGVYFVAETNKISKDRVALEKLQPEDDMEPEITGGYMMKWEQNVSDPQKRLSGWSNLELVDPDGGTEATAEQKQWIADFMHDADDRTESATFTDSMNGYRPVIDTDSFANLLVINELTRDQDAYMRSAYLYKDRGGKIMMGPLWDYNLTMGTGCCRNNRNATADGSDSGWQYLENNGVNEHKWETTLLEDPDFRQAFVDRWQGLREGTLEEAAFSARVDDQTSPLSQAAARNFARWNNLNSTNFTFFYSPPSQTWEEQVEFLKNWAAERMAWIDSQMTSPPVLSPEGGVVAAGSSATLGGLEGVVYYTTDGSDPRLPGGDINPSASIFEGTGLTSIPLVSREDIWTYLDDGSDQGDSDTASSPSHWTHPDFDDTTWSSGIAPLGYSNGVTTTVGYGGDFSNRHLTTYFRKTFAVTEASSMQELEMEVQYDDGVVVYLNGKLQGTFNMPAGVIGFDTEASSSLVGDAESRWQPFVLNPADLNEGANVVALELHQASSTSSDMSFDFSLTAKKPAGESPEIQVESTTVLSARALDGADWSGLKQELYLVGEPASSANLTVTEIHYHPLEPTEAEMNMGYLDQDDFEFLELMNISHQTIDLSGAHFSEGIVFKFPSGRLLRAGERVLVVRNIEAFLSRHPSVSLDSIAGIFQSETGLANGGERLTLLDINSELIFSLVYRDALPWPEASDGEGPSLVRVNPRGGSDPNQSASWRVSLSTDGNPASSDGSIFQGGDADALLTYAMGGVLPKVIVAEDGSIQIELTLNVLAEDIAGALEISRDLNTWSTAATEFTPISSNYLGEGMALIRYRGSKSPLEGKRFLRYVVRRP